jgi:hypothetical protein
MRLIASLVVGLLISATPSAGSQKSDADEKPRPGRDRAAESHTRQKPRHMLPSEAHSKALLTHDRNQKRDKGRVRKPKPLKRDDVVVIEDDGAIVTRARPENFFDIWSPVSIEFTPAGDGYTVTTSDEGPDVYGSQFLDIDRADETVEVPLGFAFSFFGHTYSSLWVNGAGNVTFGRGDTDPVVASAPRDIPRFSAGPPRIAPLYSDLFPSVVAVAALGDRMVITWDTWGSFEDGVQAVIRADGSIRFSYLWAGQVIGFIGDSVVGISPGDTASPVHVVDYLSVSPTAFGRGVIAEPFGATLNLFDLALQQLTFAPVDGGFAISRGPATFAADVGPSLPISAPGSRAVVPLPFAFPFVGRTHTEAVITDNGTIAFGTDRCFTGAQSVLDTPPCIFVFGRTLQPSLGGSIHATSSADRVVITWVDVPSGSLIVNAQATLYSDGQVVLSYPRPIPQSFRVVVGVSGGRVSTPIREVDFTAQTPVTVQARTVLEEFTGVFEHFDLFDQSVTFSPDTGGFRVTRGTGSFDDRHHRLQDRIPVDCDWRTEVCRSAELTLPFAFPFLGRSHTRLYVNASGNVTFGAPDTRDVNAATMLGGPPRITVTGFSGESRFTAQVGRVSAFADASGAVITWDRLVVEDTFGGVSENLTLQLNLRPDGTIHVVYANVAASGVVGVSEGANAGPIHEIDFTTVGSEALEAGMIFEDFGPDIPFATVDTIELARAFYESQPDKFDFLVVFTDFPVDLGAYAFNLPVSNATRGLGRPGFVFEHTFDFSSFYGSGGELESLLMMNNINIYWPDARRMIDPPIETAPFRRRIMGMGDGGPITGTTDPWSLGIGLDSPMSLLTHEVGHRWLAAPHIVHPVTDIGDDSEDLFNDFHHWRATTHTALPAGQFHGNPRASSMEGSVLVALGGRSFPSDSGLPDCNPGEQAFLSDPLYLWDGYSHLDQYFMGLRSAWNVDPFYYIDGARPVFRPPPPRGEPPLPPSPYRAPTCGTRVDLSVSDIVAHPEMGPRAPFWGDEDDGRGVDVKTMAFVLLTMNPNHEDAIRRVDTFRKAWEKYGNGIATGGRGRFDTSLRPKIH